MKRVDFIVLLLLLPALLLGLAGCGQQGPETLPEDVTILKLGLPGESKTTIGTSQDGKRKVYWADGDCICLNGAVSYPLDGVEENQTSASFRVQGSFTLPYNVLYPASLWKDDATVTLPASSNWSATVAAPMACRITEADGEASLKHLSTVLRLAVLGSGQLSSVSFKGNAGEQVCGDFSIDYQAGTLTSASTADADKELVMTVGQELSADTPLELFLCIPSQNYGSGFTVTLSDSDGKSMSIQRGSAIECAAGHILVPAAITYAPSQEVSAFEFGLGEMEMDVLVLGDYNVHGRVVDTAGNPLEGVVVTDGEVCVKTFYDGSFYLMSEFEASDFIYISTPAGYLPPVEGGIPKFYKDRASLSWNNKVLECGDFVLTPVANPDNCTIFFTADPQPRGSKWSMDNIAYRSLACCNDLYKELKETAASVTGRQVYGICLGDIVHEDMALFSNYADGLSTLGYPTFNVIGNHDNDPTAYDDAGGAGPFESWFGPRNYSFNIGKMHFVMLDDLAMYRSGGELKSYNNGLDDIAWNWLSADLATVSKNTTLMVCAHAAMFRKSPDGEVSGREATLHGEDYGSLIRSFSKIHAWAGHSHSTFNYIYPTTHRYRNLEVHTLARSTGELWTNEYLSAGTPRGFTVVEIRNGVIDSWRFHPTKYQSDTFRGSKKPAYKYRDWIYNSSGVAMRNGKPLDESYQMHVYPPGSYASGDGYMYVNVFLWDTKWDNPVLISGGTTREMELVTASDKYDLGEYEIDTFYKANSSILKGYSGYPATPSENYPHTLFRVSAPASGSGTVMVTDRFGNEYRQAVSW